MVISSSQVDELEQRFMHLLQPTKDLTKYFDIDIVTELNDYIDEIDKIVITFDGGKTTLNFSEAALLIQGSTGVYSKKVDYLYILVCNVLELLSSKKDNSEKKSTNPDGEESEDNAGTTQDEEYLALDDTRVHENINTKKDSKSFDKMAHVVPQIPLALIKLTDDTQNAEFPLLSVKGEVLGSKKDFKMNNCDLQASGVILLDLSYLSILGVQHSAPALDNTEEDVEVRLSAEGATDAVGDVPMAGAEELPLFDQSGGDNDAAGANDSGCFEDNGIADDLIDEQNKTGQRDQQEEVAVLRSRGKRDEIATRKVAETPTVDIFKLLDPKDETTRNLKPLKEGKGCIRYSSGIEKKDNASKRKSSKIKRQNQDKCNQSIFSFFGEECYFVPSDLPAYMTKYFGFDVFEMFFEEAYKNRKQNKNQILKELNKENKGKEKTIIEKDDHREDVDGADNAEDAGEEEEDVFEAPDLLDADLLHESAGWNTQAEVDRLHDELDEAPIVKNYEDLVREYVGKFMANAQQYAKTSELSQQVAEWEEKIRPRLDEEESHEPFDIHKCGTTVIDFVPNRNDWIPFRKIVENRPLYTVSRLFLSTLQLANNNNVLIETDGILDEGIDTMRLKLLSKKRHFEDIEGYTAPSAGD